eukprot:885625-Karenia_brevis.AAC.1
MIIVDADDHDDDDDDDDDDGDGGVRGNLILRLRYLLMPRGAQPTNDYEQHIGERDYEPTAPFHHNYHFFAEAGDL